MAARAAEDLAAIRAAMERSRGFRSVPGASGVLMGVIGVITAFAAGHAANREQWLETWLFAGALASSLGACEIFVRAAARRERREAIVRLFGSLAPAFVSTLLLTAALWSASNYTWLPALWLFGYGTAMLAAAPVTLRPVGWMGAGFLALGALALFTPESMADVWLGLGFGGLQSGFGIWIARHRNG